MIGRDYPTEQRAVISAPKDEGREIVKRFQSGHPTAEQELKMTYLRFVSTFAKSCQRYGLTQDEAMAAGEKGLIQAARSYNITSKFRFICFAVWYIKEYLKQAGKEKERIIHQ